jgi:hypothetical protein
MMPVCRSTATASCTKWPIAVRGLGEAWRAAGTSKTQPWVFSYTSRVSSQVSQLFE